MVHLGVLPEEWRLAADTVVHPHFIVVQVYPAKGLGRNGGASVRGYPEMERETVQQNQFRGLSSFSNRIQIVSILARVGHP